MDPKWKRDVDLVADRNPLGLVGIVKGSAWSDAAKIYAYAIIQNALGTEDAEKIIRQ